MEDLRAGTGGWAYFSIPGMDSLQAYSRAFNYVEVNTTFYQVPPMEMVKGWRKRVPEDFLFSVRCHRSVTHAHAFDPNSVVLERMAEMVRITRELRAEVLHLLTPPGFKFEKKDVDNLGALLDSVPPEGAQLALEPRAYVGRPLPDGLRGLMESRGITHSVDLSKDEPQVESPILYTRLFGKGYHTVYQFSDDELGEIHAKGTSREYRRALFTFHGVRMYSDAGRFLSYAKSGGFPSAQAPGQRRLA